MIDLIIGALLIFAGAYLLSKAHKETTTEKVKNIITGILDTARKLVAYILIILLCIFILGEFYAAWCFGIWPTSKYYMFWIPSILLILLVLYYYFI
jgi:hypothetical protein